MMTQTPSVTSADRRPHRLCPWWMGYVLNNPLRRFLERPGSILEAHVRPGMTVVDLGCAMGFFSFPLARLVGDDGRVVCVDVQERMLQSLSRRIRRQNLQLTMETRHCQPNHLGLEDLVGQADLVLAWHVVHEVPDPAGFFRECCQVLCPGGRLLFAEPGGHVSETEIEQEFELARQAGLNLVEHTKRRCSYVAVFEK